MSQREGRRLFRGLLAAEDRPVRRQEWLKAGKYVPKNPELDPEIEAHTRESVEGILDEISGIEGRQAERLVAKIRRNIAGPFGPRNKRLSARVAYRVAA